MNTKLTLKTCLLFLTGLAINRLPSDILVDPPIAEAVKAPTSAISFGGTEKTAEVSLCFKSMLATSSCLYAGLGCELLLAVSNDMRYLGEQELVTKGRNTSETSSEHSISYIQK